MYVCNLAIIVILVIHWAENSWDRAVCGCFPKSEPSFQWRHEVKSLSNSFRWGLEASPTSTVGNSPGAQGAWSVYVAVDESPASGHDRRCSIHGNIRRCLGWSCSGCWLGCRFHPRCTAVAHGCLWWTIRPEQAKHSQTNCWISDPETIKHYKTIWLQHQLHVICAA